MRCLIFTRWARYSFRIRIDKTVALRFLHAAIAGTYELPVGVVFSVTGVHAPHHALLEFQTVTVTLEPNCVTQLMDIIPLPVTAAQ